MSNSSHNNCLNEINNSRRFSIVDRDQELALAILHRYHPSIKTEAERLGLKDGVPVEGASVLPGVGERGERLGFPANPETRVGSGEHGYSHSDT